MRVYPISVPAGEQIEFAATGNYVRVRQSSVALKIQHDNGDFIEVDQGDDFEFEPFQRLRISHESGTDQQIKLVIARGKKSGSSKVGGAVSVNNFPATQTVVNVEPEKPQAYAASYSSNVNLAANTAVQVFSAASNVNGATLHSATMTALVGAGAGIVALVAKAAAPANNADGAVILSVGSGATSAAANSATLQKPIKIPAGVGLYFISSVAESYSLKGVQYTLD